MELIGSITSPYVRRNRLALFAKKHEFVTIDVFSSEGQERLSELGGIRKIPVLVDDNKVIWDSMLIHKYITGESFNLEQEKDLVLINEASDSGILLFQFIKFELDPKHKNKISKNQKQRLKDILQYFDEFYTVDSTYKWETRDQWLYCLLDWLTLRDVIKWKNKFLGLEKFYNFYGTREDVIGTDPRL